MGGDSSISLVLALFELLNLLNQLALDHQRVTVEILVMENRHRRILLADNVRTAHHLVVGEEEEIDIVSEGPEPRNVFQVVLLSEVEGCEDCLLRLSPIKPGCILSEELVHESKLLHVRKICLEHALLDSLVASWLLSSSHTRIHLGVHELVSLHGIVKVKVFRR